jgi:hypothetical protein
MKVDDGDDGIFSLEARRDIERRTDEARAEALARGKRALGRLAYERELAETRAELRKEERAACRGGSGGRESRGDAWGLVAVVKEQLRRLLFEDGPAMRAVSDDVAGAIRRSGRESGGETPAAHRPQEPGGGQHGKPNGTGRRSPWG